MEKDNLMKHGGIVLFASVVSFFFGYLFHSYMGRNLGPEDYGVLDALLSIFFIVLIPVSTIQAVVSKFSSVYIGTDRPECIKLLIIEGFKKLLFWGFLIFILIFILSPFISDFLKIGSEIPIILLGIAIILAFLLPMSRGVLQGIQNFNHFGINISLEKIILFISGVGLISFGVNGAMLSLVISLLFVFLISFIPMKVIREKKSNDSFKSAKIINYSIPVFISLSAVAIMSNIDMLLVKHYFDPVQAGGYAAIGMMGKVLFFLSFNIANVILPKASVLSVQKKESVFLLRKGLFLMGMISFSIIMLYAIFPEKIINLVFGAEYNGFISLLAPYSAAMAIMAFVVIIVHYNLSIMNFFYIKSLIFSTIMEVLLLILFHENLMQVIVGILLSSSILLLLILNKSLKNNFKK